MVLRPRACAGRAGRACVAGQGRGEPRHGCCGKAHVRTAVTPAVRCQGPIVAVVPEHGWVGPGP